MGKINCNIKIQNNDNDKYLINTRILINEFNDLINYFENYIDDNIYYQVNTINIYVLSECEIDLYINVSYNERIHLYNSIYQKLKNKEYIKLIYSKTKLFKNHG